MKNYEVYENNAGGLALVVYDGTNERPEYIHTGYEYNRGQLSEDIEALKAGDDPAMMWDGNEISDFSGDSSFSGDWGRLIADNDGIYPDWMGAAGRIEFNISV